MKQKILVSGANGQLGQEIKEIAASFPAFEFIFLSREDLAIENEDSVNAVFKRYSPHYFVNCAAYTAVDKAETDAATAEQVNAIAPGLIATACKEFNTRLIHISTDYVFDGQATQPYKEDDPTNPQSVYGSSKLRGEQNAIKANEETVIIRTAWVYSTVGKNFVKTMLRLMSEKESISVVSDQVGSPTYAADLAAAILRIITSGEWHPGIFHYSNAGVISWYDFAVAIRDLSGSKCLVKPISTAEYPTPARRPAFSVMNTQKIHEQYAVEIIDWKISLEYCLQRLKAQG